MPQATKDLEASPYDHLLRVLGDALDVRDNETAGHSRRVVRYSLEIGTAMGCSDEQMTPVARGAFVHDIGKIAIPDVILQKPGKLTPEEFEVMETHAWIGYNMLTGVSSLVPVADIVLSHHERWDGRGYPRRLKGEEIPVGARIFAIADTLDAMTTDRPYRKALRFAAAQAEVEREAGKQFDPRIVSVFLSIPEAEMRGVVLSEKTRSLRVPLDAKVRCGVHGECRVLQAINIGEGGMLLGNALGMEIGMVLDIEFSLPGMGNLLETKAKVVRKELPARIGVTFADTPTGTLGVISKFVRQRVGA